MVATIPDVFTITGRVVDSDVDHARDGFRVELWDRDLLCDDKLGSVMTDPDGTFTVSFERAKFGSELFVLALVNEYLARQGASNSSESHP